MNFVTSVFKKYINKNEIHEQDKDKSTLSADERALPNKESDALKQPSIAPNSLLKGKVNDTKLIDEEETFQDAETDSMLYNQGSIKNGQIFKLTGQAATQPSLNRASTTIQNNHIQGNQDFKPQDLKSHQRDSFTVNITEPDSLNASMVDSLEVSKSVGLLLENELTDSIEVLRYESSRESSSEPATLHAEDPDEYVSLSQILTDSIEDSDNVGEASQSVESSFGGKCTPRETSLTASSNDLNEEPANTSEGTVEKLIKNVNETLVVSATASENTSRDALEKHFEETTIHSNILKQTENMQVPKEQDINVIIVEQNMGKLRAEEAVALESPETKKIAADYSDTIGKFEPKTDIPIDADLKSDAPESNVIATANIEELSKSQMEHSKKKSPKCSENSEKSMDIKVENVNPIDQNNTCLPKSPYPIDQNAECEVERTSKQDSIVFSVGALPKHNAKLEENVDAKAHAETTDERIRVYERQETQELDEVLKRLEATTDTKSALDQNKHVPFDRQDTQEFEKLEKKFEGIAGSSYTNATDDLLDMLIANSMTDQNGNTTSPGTPKGKPDVMEKTEPEKYLEKQNAQHIESEALNKQLERLDINQAEINKKIGYERQDTKEFENLERQYADDILDQLVSESNQVHANEEPVKSESSKKARKASSGRSDFLLGMIEAANTENPFEEVDCNQRKNKETIALDDNGLNCTTAENSSPIVLHQENEPKREVDELNKGDASSNHNSSIRIEVKTAKGDKLEHAEQEVNEINTQKVVQGVKQSGYQIEQLEIEVPLENKITQNSTPESHKSEDTQNEYTTAINEQLARTDKIIAKVNGREHIVAVTDALAETLGESGKEEKTHCEEGIKNQENSNSKQEKLEVSSKTTSTTDSVHHNNAVQEVNSMDANRRTAETNGDAISKLKKDEVLSATFKEDSKLALASPELNINISKQQKSEERNGANEEPKNKENEQPYSVKTISKKNLLKYENGSNKIDKYRKLLGQYEERILQQSKELEKLKAESDTNFRHFTNTEMAFSDVFEKYEKAKSVIILYKQNEDILVENIHIAEEQLSQLETKCAAMKRQSVEQIRRAQQETEEEKQKYRRDLAKLHAQVKRLEIKAGSLEIELSQKTEECQALASLCDEITGRH